MNEEFKRVWSDIFLANYLRVKEAGVQNPVAFGSGIGPVDLELLVKHSSFSAKDSQ